MTRLLGRALNEEPTSSQTGNRSFLTKNTNSEYNVPHITTGTRSSSLHQASASSKRFQAVTQPERQGMKYEKPQRRGDLKTRVRWLGEELAFKEKPHNLNEVAVKRGISRDFSGPNESAYFHKVDILAQDGEAISHRKKSLGEEMHSRVPPPTSPSDTSGRWDISHCRPLPIIFLYVEYGSPCHHQQW
ncbi:hypothetical protein BGX38DRAFT_1263359, partial [Terfezia claveryi]